MKYNNYFCFTILDAITAPTESLLGIEERLSDLTPHFYQASIRSLSYRSSSEEWGDNASEDEDEDETL